MNKRISFWQKKLKGKKKGPKYHGHYMLDAGGERVFVLSRILKNNRIHNVTAESTKMAEHAGWAKVK